MVHTALMRCARFAFAQTQSHLAYDTVSIIGNIAQAGIFSRQTIDLVSSGLIFAILRPIQQNCVYLLHFQPGQAVFRAEI